jgi:hypothetical protein
MSTFLGPIHYWLYNKIRLQQEIVDELYSFGEKSGIALEDECNRLYGTFENKPLEEMIDHGNIHAWLQDRVSQVEYKYAYAVTALLKNNPESYISIKNIVANNGTRLAIFLKELPFDASGIYKAINDYLLDGMPCDHVNKVIKQGDREVVWTKTTCVHSKYWEEVGGDINIYYELRDYWIEALVKELGFLFEKPDKDTYRVLAYGAD